MGWSWRLVRVFGIDVKIHWTFFLLFVYIAFIAGGDLLGFAVVSGLIIAVFACVVLHELGHALTARRYGVATRDITLLPIGGVARLERIPSEPWQELWIALAGPAVNVVIAMILAAGLIAAGQTIWRPDDMDPIEILASGKYFAHNLLYVNVFLVAFNALPAFPMDGGRVLRALLAMRLDYLRATEIAASFGKAMALLFFVAGILSLPPNPFLVLIAVFVYMGATAEARMAQFKALTSGLPVSSAMMTRFHALRSEDTLQAAAAELLAGSQQDFPVVEGDELRGLLNRQELVESLNPAAGVRTVGEAMNATVEVADEHEMLEDVLLRMHAKGSNTLPVVRQGEDGKPRLVGLLTLENIGEFMMIRTAIRSGGRAQRMSQTGE